MYETLFAIGFAGMLIGVIIEIIALLLAIIGYILKALFGLFGDIGILQAIALIPIIIVIVFVVAGILMFMNTPLFLIVRETCKDIVRRLPRKPNFKITQQKKSLRYRERKRMLNNE